MAHRCISCDSDAVISFDGRVAPFIGERVPTINGKSIRLYQCYDCGMSFFYPRYSDDEMSALYNNYRDTLYQQQRQRHEPHYTPEINSSIGTCEEEIKNRKCHMVSTLSKYCDLQQVKSILDYGGDKGQYIPEECHNANKVVFEISGQQPIDGVTTISDWNKIANNKYDLILCNHVLEHSPDPKKILLELQQLLSANGFLYIEVPFEKGFGVRIPKTLSIKYIIRRLGLSLVPEMSKDRITKHKNNIYYMHEHINFFTLKSLKHLIKGSRFQLLHIEEARIAVGWTTMRALSCVATRLN